MGSSYKFLISREYLPEVKLYNYRNRHYDARLGRFLQPDPILFEAGDVNIYRYVGNNGVNVTDPFGLQPNRKKSCCGGKEYTPGRAGNGKACCGDEESGTIYNRGTECCQSGNKVVNKVPRYKAQGKSLNECINDALSGTIADDCVEGATGAAGGLLGGACTRNPGGIIGGAAGGAGLGAWATRAIAKSWCRIKVCSPQ